MTLYEEQRRLRVEPQAMLGLMAWQLHILALVKAAGKKSSAEIASEAGVSPYVVSKTVPIAARLTMEEIKQLVHHALALDIRLKTESIDSDSAMQHLLLSIATLARLFFLSNGFFGGWLFGWGSFGNFFDSRFLGSWLFGGS